ncbi:hypothetical protein N8D56_19835 [Devosia sp. A8/3-2]|nr:hypothetical protein N8D56_19835 [Devosia sp. A8/3-2]
MNQNASALIHFTNPALRALCDKKADAPPRHCRFPKLLMAKSTILARFGFVSADRVAGPQFWRAIVPLRWQEVAMPLAVIVVLLLLKHVPATASLPLARAAGVVAFGYAAFLALRLVQGRRSHQR